jgi:hypothetical protein
MDHGLVVVGWRKTEIKGFLIEFLNIWTGRNPKAKVV